MPPQRMPIASKAARKSAPSTMNAPQHPRERKHNRTEFDFKDTFEVVVGRPASEAKRFSMHTGVVTGRSGILATMLRVEPDNQKKVVYLENQDPELFQQYVHCVYFGPQALQKWAAASEVKKEPNPDGHARDEDQAAADLVFEKLIRLYILAAKLVDFETASMVVDKIIRTSDSLGFIPTQGPISVAYASTDKGSPLRALLRDYWIYESALIETDSERLRADNFPVECLQDIAIEMLRIVNECAGNFDETVKDLCSADVCRYHHHNGLYTRCVVGE